MQIQMFYFIIFESLAFIMNICTVQMGSAEDREAEKQRRAAVRKRRQRARKAGQAALRPGGGGDGEHGHKGGGKQPGAVGAATLKGSGGMQKGANSRKKRRKVD